jgi:hypothetical protein
MAFEPQRIRQFIVTFNKTVVEEKAPVAVPIEKEEPKSENLGKNDHTNIDRI